VDVLNTYRWLLELSDMSARIITDMTRYEMGSVNHFAGLELVETLRNDYKFQNDILIFCQNEDRARNNCTIRKITRNVFVTNEQMTVELFVNFGRVPDRCGFQ